MKNLLSKKIVLFMTVVTMLSSFVALAKISQLWREISEKQAKAQSLNIPSWAPLVEKSQPAVVVISTEAVFDHNRQDGLPGPFRFFMPLPPEKQQGQGSGFIINEDGYVITNEHVIQGAQKIKVMVGTNPREYKAKVIGSDEALDIALLKIEPEENEKIIWPYLPLGDSDSIKLGDPIMALGSPLGLVQSVNVGIVSHKHRGGIKPSGRDLYVELIQLQVPINPGNSGGPVLDDSGRVIGISESILASGQSIAFCVPSETIKTVIAQLMNKGSIEQAFLGVEPIDLTTQLARELGLSPNERGAVLAQVVPNTPAERAGLKAGDVILEIDGKKVSDSFNLRSQTAYKGIGNTVTLKVHRKGVGLLKEIKVKLEKRPGQASQPSKNIDQNLASMTIESLGLKVVDTSAENRRELGLSSKNPGAQVAGISRSAAENSSLAIGDIITKVDNTLITSAKQLKDLIDKAPKEKTFMMLTRRGQAERFVAVEKQ